MSNRSKEGSDARLIEVRVYGSKNKAELYPDDCLERKLVLSPGALREYIRSTDTQSLATTIFFQFYIVITGGQSVESIVRTHHYATKNISINLGEALRYLEIPDEAPGSKHVGQEVTEPPTGKMQPLSTQEYRKYQADQKTTGLSDLTLKVGKILGSNQDNSKAS